MPIVCVCVFICLKQCQVCKLQHQVKFVLISCMRDKIVCALKWMRLCVCACPVDTLRFNLITAGVMGGSMATDGLNKTEIE